MKKKLLIICSCALLLFVITLNSSFVQPESETYYYAFNEKIRLKKLNNKIAVRYKNKDEALKMRSLFSKANKTWQDERTIVYSAQSGEILRLPENEVINDVVLAVNPVYALPETGLEMIVTDEILLKFLDSSSKASIDSINNIYGLKLLKKTDNYWLFQVPKGTDALQISTKYQESGLVVFAQPNFLSEIELHQASIPNDPYFMFQWNLHNTGQSFNGHTGTFNADINAPEAWSITTGCSSVVVAVLDDGVTANHIDLPNTRQVRLPGSNFGDGNPDDPSPTGNMNHGNACAGIIAASRNNNIGIAGIAPDVKIMPIRIFNSNKSSVSVQSVADAITFAKNNGADIISNSWGYTSSNQSLHPVIITAIQDAVTNGRNGKGCVVVFAAGNSGYVSFPAGVNVSGVLTVGASDRYDKKSVYSASSSLIDIVAPSHKAYPHQEPGETFEVWSIDIPGNSGYNPWQDNFINPPSLGEVLPNSGANHLDFTGRFGGTSASCPQVAAVAALMLSINPNLTQQQVFSGLVNGADKVGNYSYPSGKSNELGYGRLNALNALQHALPTISGASIVCSSQTYSVDNLYPGASVTWSSTWTSAPRPTLVHDYPSVNQLTINNTYKYPSTTTLTATITGPCGTIVLTKQIMSETETQVQSGTYFQEACTFYNTAHPSSSGSLPTTVGTPLYLRQGCLTTISLNNMVGKSVTFTGSIQPLYWSYNSAESKLYLKLPYMSAGTPFMFKISGDGACHEKSLLFFSHSQPYYNFSIAPNPVNSQYLTISATPSEELLAQKGIESAASELEYSVNIINLTSGETVVRQVIFKGHLKERINISTLNKGLYNLQIIWRDDVQNIKFIKE